jgi:hypothetical protein
VDTLELLGVARHQGQATGEGLSCNEQVIRADGQAHSFQFGADARGRFRCYAVQWEFDDGGDELLDFLTLFGRLPGFLRPGRSNAGSLMWMESKKPSGQAFGLIGSSTTASPSWRTKTVGGK